MATIKASIAAAIRPLDQGQTHLWPVTAGTNELQHLTVGGCDVVELATTYGTPLYLIDEFTLQESCDRFRRALAKHYPRTSAVHYACKALLNTAITHLIGEAGLGFDVVSGGELHVALHAGALPSQIHFQGNAKTRSELEYAVGAGVARIVVDNQDELLALRAVARAANKQLQISLRVSPDVAAVTHAHIQTGHAESKFGFPLESIDRAVQSIQGDHAVLLTGLHFHLGSQIFDLKAYEQSIPVVLDLAMRLRDRFGIDICELSPGGGLATGYIESEPSPEIEDFVATVARSVVQGCAKRSMPLPHLVLEPGRSIIARAGVALYRIVGSKPLPPGGSANRYVHLDGGMADNIRPALYGAQYMAQLANRMSAARDETVHLSGRYCESSDVLIRGLKFPGSARVDDVVAVPMSGAYTLSMSSNYNGALRPAMLLVGDGCSKLIQRREEFSDLVQRDVALNGADTESST